MSFICRELRKIESALHQEEDEGRKRELYAARQALGWALEPRGYKAPYNMIMGILPEKEDCLVHNHPLLTSDTSCHCGLLQPPK